MHFPFRPFARYFMYLRPAMTNLRLRRALVTTGGIAGGGGTLLSLGLFGSAKRKEEGKKLPGEEDLILREADMLYQNYLIDNAYNLLRRHRSSEDPEFLWRLARVLYEQSKQTKNAAEKKRLSCEALEYAEKALKFESATGCFGAHKWYAITLSYTSELEGDKARISTAMDVKRHFERALEINPLDATTWHSLGVWHYSFATLSAYARWAASVIYSKPPQSTIEEALRHLERAEAISPNFYPANNYYLGLCYERLNRREEAQENLEKAAVAPVISVDDMEIHKKALEHLTKNYKIDVAELLREQK